MGFNSVFKGLMTLLVTIKESAEDVGLTLISAVL